MSRTTQFGSLLQFPGRFPALAALAVAATGLSPIVACLTLPEGGPLFRDLTGMPAGVDVVFSHGNGGLFAVGFVGALALAVALAHGVAWLDDRVEAWLVRMGVRPGDARAVCTAGFVLAIALLGWAGVLGAMSAGTDAVHRQFDTVGKQVCERIEAALDRDAPPDEFPMPTGNPLPALQRLVALPAVSRAYFEDATGRLTILARGRAPEVIDTATWRPHRTQVRWKNEQPTKAEIDREYHDRDIDSLVFGGGRFWRSEHHQFVRRFDLSSAGYFGFADQVPVFEKDVAHARLGFQLDERYWWHVERPILDDAGIFCEVMIGDDLQAAGYRVLGRDFDGSVRKAHRTWKRVGLSLTSFEESDLVNQRRLLFGLTAGALSPLAVALLFAFVRRLRGLWADRAISLAQSNFVSGVSHEMRTPLATIKLYAELMRDGVSTEPRERQELLATITHECDRLSRLIENVLDFSRISGRRKTYVFQPVTAEDLAETALAAVAGPLATSGLALQRHVPPELGFLADRDALVQAVVNLLANAIKYASEGGALLLAFAPAEPGYVSILVKDFGPGIPANEHQRVFQPFYRVGNELTRTATGSGLGLALVKEHVKAHGGRVELESTPGGGATFRLVLPVDPTLQRKGWKKGLAA